MLKNYFKIAWRNLAKHKFYSVINIAGLTIGIACCLLIGLYLSHELSYDRFHKNAERIFRVTTEYTVNGQKSFDGTTGSMTGPRLASAFPQIESYVRLRNFDPYSVQYQEKVFVEDRFFFGDSSFFKIFSFPLIEGDPQTALDAPGKIIITRSIEKKYFGNEPALGKTLRVGGTSNYIVTGVTQDPPSNSQIKFSLIASYSSLPNANRPNWWIHIYTTFFLLRNNKDAPALEKSIADYMKNQKDVGQTGNDYLVFHLEPMTRVHLYSTLPGLEPNGNITYIYILAAVALLILCIACVNYTNLATAQAAHRIPEIGIRKVLGSMKWQLFWQFIGESLLINFFAFLFAIILAVITIPSFNLLIESPLHADSLLDPFGVMLMLLLYLLISFASGAYPAFILSRLKLIKVLKTGFSFSGNSGILRKLLITFQFIVSVFLIIATIIILQQLSYIQHKDLGFDQDHVLVLPVDGLVRSNYRSIKEAINSVPNVQSVSCGAEETTNINWDDEINTTADASAPFLFASASPTDIDFVKTMGLHIRSGTDFTLSDWEQLSLPGDKWRTTYMLNESAVKAMGWTPESAIGKTIYRSGQRGAIKAVLKDFHFAPLHEPIRPLVIFLDSQYYHIYQMFVRISGRDMPSTLKEIGNVWKDRVPHRPFQYHFLDENYNRLYHTERQTGKIFSSFSALAIVLACLGLFALAAYITIQRAKEIGIRKVLGASTIEVVRLITVEFVKLVLIASLVAFPLAWLFMHRWLQQFAYRIEINWLVFFAAGFVTAFIALISISFQAIRAAMANPVKSLRTE